MREVSPKAEIDGYGDELDLVAHALIASIGRGVEEVIGMGVTKAPARDAGVSIKPPGLTRRRLTAAT